MASLSVRIRATGETTAKLTGSFTGGASEYSYQRILELTIDGWGSVDIYSEEDSGGDNTFSYTITGLAAGTTYDWEVVLYYRTTGGWTASDYTDNGSFVTDSSSGGDSAVYVYYSGSWRAATPYIYYGGNWRPCDAYVYYSGNWNLAE